MNVTLMAYDISELDKRQTHQTATVSNYLIRPEKPKKRRAEEENLYKSR